MTFATRPFTPRRAEKENARPAKTAEKSAVRFAGATPASARTPKRRALAATPLARTPRATPGAGGATPAALRLTPRSDDRPGDAPADERSRALRARVREAEDARARAEAVSRELAARLAFLEELSLIHI